MAAEVAVIVAVGVNSDGRGGSRDGHRAVRGRDVLDGEVVGIFPDENAIVRLIGATRTCGISTLNETPVQMLSA